jgi:hypothetical protein
MGGRNAWHFAAAAGREELLARRIGRNEMQAIDIASDYLDMQADYASVDRDGDGVREYAQRLLSTPGQQDGLHWEDSTSARSRDGATRPIERRTLMRRSGGGSLS